MNVFVVVKVNGSYYLSKVVAESLAGAEHFILDRAYCGKHEYGVQAVQAFSAKEMKTDTFIGSALYSLPVSFGDLCDIIEANNTRIVEAEKAETEREQTLSEIAELEKRLAELRSIL